MKNKMLSLYGLKYNPFSSEIPASALFVSPQVDSFCWRIEQQVGVGGFALVSGAPGTGKSAALRILTSRLSDLRDVSVGVITRPQASMADFYRELGHLFSVTISPHNRWCGAKTLREKWQSAIETSLFRPVLIVDEAQEMSTVVFNELRFLSSADLDSRSILTVLIAGDDRLTTRLQTPEMLPLGSRIRTRLRNEYCSPKELQECLTHLLKRAGNPALLSTELMITLCDHAAGNYRALMNMANELLAAAAHTERDKLDEKLFFEVFSPEPKTSRKRKKP